MLYLCYTAPKQISGRKLCCDVDSLIDYSKYPRRIGNSQFKIGTHKDNDRLRSSGFGIYFSFSDFFWWLVLISIFFSFSDSFVVKISAWKVTTQRNQFYFQLKKVIEISPVPSSFSLFTFLAARSPRGSLPLLPRGLWQLQKSRILHSLWQPCHHWAMFMVGESRLFSPLWLL